MQIVLTNLSNNLYEKSRFLLNESAKKFGIQEINSYHFDDLKGTKFFKEHKEVLNYPKGLGYWLWKPHIILEAFKKINKNDVVIYSDCGIEIIKNLTPLIDICINKSSIVLFANGNFTNKIWTKRDCFILMNCDSAKYWNGYHIDAAFSLFKKNEESIKFLEEWLLYGSNQNIITDLPNICGEKNLPEFIEHRWDQSILSLLAIKNSIVPFRMPTQFGNHYKSSKYRINEEFNCINQLDQTQLDYYSDLPFTNSNYGQLLNHHRKKMVMPHNSNNASSPTNSILSPLKSLLRGSKNKPKDINKNKSTKLVTHFRKLSYSQCGEDLLIKYIFDLRGISKPSYIDIGANHPFFISNTALFYELGCRGINIEANPKLIYEFKKYRPNDINLNIGVSDKEEELEFYVMEDNTLSTFSEVEYEFMISNGKKLQEKKKIKLKTLSSILREYNNNEFPNFMSLDVEGMDFKILQSINFEQSFPKIICVEAAEYSPIGAGARRNELIDFLVSKGYYEYANTNLNAIMVKKEFWFI